MEVRIMTPEIILFIILQVINVILSTIKSIVMIKGSKWGAIIANTIYFGVYTAVLKQISAIDNLFVLVVITMLANFFGTWVGIVITDKLRKADLWIIKTVIKIGYVKDYKKALNNAGIKYISYQTTWDEYTAIDIFSESRTQSKKIKEILLKFKAKYSIYKSHQDL
jgi:uncharacterized protein YebE (UPF0316 family)